MSEGVRLVIWDLDETFWKGTLTEGGIEEYSVVNHNLVIELARRGIMNSICSKNDFDAAAQILKNQGILEYFVFPSISWAPKGGRVAAIIEAFQLRPSTVMFIDDNPSNRAEAAAVVPGLQIETEAFIPKLLADPRFKGKDDAGLVRLAQYKLLERRQQNAAKSEGSNEDFLRSCNIRVHLEFDIAAHIDRAIELINRTNQLNYTKKRLPEDATLATARLVEELSQANRQAALVRVMDDYGDYGFVGFFLMESLPTKNGLDGIERELQHFCFSCRTLGMLVEKWLYDYLGMPRLSVVGEVLTDLSIAREVDWIRRVESLDATTSDARIVAPEIRLWGGCEANALGFYLQSHTPSLRTIANFTAGGLFVRMNSAVVLMSASERSYGRFTDEAAALGLPEELVAFDIFGDAEPGMTIIVNSSIDASPYVPRYVHKSAYWSLILEPCGVGDVDLTTDCDEVLSEKLSRAWLPTEEARQQVTDASSHMRQFYASSNYTERGVVDAAARRMLDRVPIGSRFIFLLDSVMIREADGVVRLQPDMVEYTARMRDIVAAYPFARLVSYDDFIRSEEEIQTGGSHYDRIVFVRAAEALLNLITEIPLRSGALAA